LREGDIALTTSRYESNDERNGNIAAKEAEKAADQEMDVGSETTMDVGSETTMDVGSETTMDVGSETTMDVDNNATSVEKQDKAVHIDEQGGEKERIEEIEEVEQSSAKRFWPPSRHQLVTAIAFWGVILLGAVLRFWGLGDKPLHHDESLHAYFSMQLMHDLENWSSCFNGTRACYKYDPLLHGPFQFHAIALVYKISQLLGAPDHGVNTTTVRIVAAMLGTVMVGLPYFLRNRLGTVGAWLTSFMLAVSPSIVYYSRFAREDIYQVCFTLLMVVGVACYLSTRRAKWLILAAWGFALSYATNEATFLTIAVFGSFLGALLAWELGARWSVRSRFNEQQTPFYRWIPLSGSPVTLLAYFITLGIFAKVFFAWLENLSHYIVSHLSVSDQFVANLKADTIPVILILGVLLCIYVFYLLWRETRELYEPAPVERRGLAAHIDPEKQPVLDAIVTMPWKYWFLSLVLAWLTFLLLFTVVFTNIWGGITDGIWQGLYYWLQQQQVARGGEPWYYYILLIPLYEQVGVVFGLFGCVRSLLRPTRFRLFLVYWFLGNLFIYSWAAEKMPWLSIHIVLPMIMLAAVALEPAVVTLARFIKERWLSSSASFADAAPEQESVPSALSVQRKVGGLAGGGAALTVVLAVLLLLPTLQNMYQLSYIHQADAPHEMMIYVQTSNDVNIVMSRIDALDQKLDGGKHQLTIGVINDATWPFAWYLRDYTNVCFNFPAACPSMVNSTQVIISGGDNLPGVYATYGNAYAYHQYHMRTQWDQGYMPPLCQPTPSNPCTTPQPYVGVGPWLWLSYGDNPPPGATFNPALAAQRVWQWWWWRKPFGATDGSYDMALLIRRNLNFAP
jgi:uncharacterized protein (TIGR03663 family)